LTYYPAITGVTASTRRVRAVSLPIVSERRL
jgi:hypothetical protein